MLNKIFNFLFKDYPSYLWYKASFKKIILKLILFPAIFYNVLKEKK